MKRYREYTGTKRVGATVLTGEERKRCNKIIKAIQTMQCPQKPKRKARKAKKGRKKRKLISRTATKTIETSRTTRTRGKNRWLRHVDKVRKDTGLSYIDAVKEASKTYKK